MKLRINRTVVYHRKSKTLELSNFFLAMYQKISIFVKLLKHRRKKKSKQLEVSRENQITDTTSWGCLKHPFGIPGVRPMFFKPKLHKESKNGFKTINYRPSPVMIFSKNCFRCKKITKKIGRFVDSLIFLSI